MYLADALSTIQFLSQLSLTPSSAEAADPFVRFADISPGRRISFPEGNHCSVISSDR